MRRESRRLAALFLLNIPGVLFLAALAKTDQLRPAIVGAWLLGMGGGIYLDKVLARWITYRSIGRKSKRT